MLRAIAFAGVICLLGCGKDALVQCRYDAVLSALPDQPQRIDAEVVETIVHQLEACTVPPATDAGK